MFAGRFSHITYRYEPHDPLTPHHVSFMLDGRSRVCDRFDCKDKAERFAWWLNRESAAAA